MESAEETSRKMQALCASFLLLAVCTLFFVVGLSLALNFTKYEGNSDLTEELSAGIKLWDDTREAFCALSISVLVGSPPSPLSLQSVRGPDIDRSLLHPWVPTYEGCRFEAKGVRLYDEDSSLSRQNVTIVVSSVDSGAAFVKLSPVHFFRELVEISTFCASIEASSGGWQKGSGGEGCADLQQGVALYERVDFSTGVVPNANTSLAHVPVVVRSRHDPLLLAQRLYLSTLKFGLELKDQKLISIILLSVAALMSMPLLYSVLTCVGIVRKPKRIRVVAVKPGSYINTEESS